MTVFGVGVVSRLFVMRRVVPAAITFNVRHLRRTVMLRFVENRDDSSHAPQRERCQNQDQYGLGKAAHTGNRITGIRKETVPDRRSSL